MIAACRCAFQLIKTPKFRQTFSDCAFVEALNVDQYCVKQKTLNFIESEYEANRDCEIDNHRQMVNSFTLAVLILKGYVNSTDFRFISSEK